MQPIPGLSAVIDRYDALLLDLWGVVHDGSQLYPGVTETLAGLHEAGKRVIFISNAPRRAFKAAEVLTRLGVPPQWYDHIITSGELGYRALRGDAGGKNVTPSLHISPSSHPCYYYIGPPRDADILDGLDYRRSDDIKDSDFLLNVGFGSDEQSAGDWQMLLRAARALGLPMLCLNPDFEVVKISGERYACAGVIAADYERMGGVARYFGKPFPEIYAYCLEWLGSGKERILAVGDGIATDIAGAVGFGLDCALVTGGILKKKSEEVESLCRAHGAVPNYVMPSLAW